MFKKNKIANFLLLAICFQCFAQQQLSFQNYSVDDGLISNTIWAINQDSQGYMWFGTKNGLSRFDGYNFKSYQYSSSSISKQGLKNNFIHAILEYDDTTLWIGTTKGIYILKLQKDSFNHFEPLGDRIVNDIKKDEKGVVWIATPRGLFGYNPLDGNIVNYNTKSEGLKKLPSNDIRKLTIDNEGRVWMATFGRGVAVLNPQKGIVKNYRRPKGLADNRILTIYKDLIGRIWVGTLGGGLSLWEPNKDRFKTYTKSTSGISSNIVRAILQVKSNELLIGTEKGLNVLNISQDNFVNHKHKTSDVNSLSGNSVYSIFQDKAGGVWLGTYFGGLSYFNYKSTGFDKYYPSEEEHSITGGGVSCFLEDEPGKFWVGTEDGGLNYFDSQTGEFKRYPFEKKQEPLSYDNIHSLYKDRKGRLWIGTFSGGLNIYDKKTGKVKVYKSRTNDPSTLTGNNVFSIYEDKDGIIWVGTTNGLNTYDPDNDSFKRVNEVDRTRRFITDIYEDEAGTIWFATYGNLIGLRKKSGDWVKFDNENKSGIFGDGRISIIDDHEGNLWIGTEGNGLMQFNFREKSFKSFGASYGLHANIVYDILQGEDRTLWLSTNNGIYHFDPHTEEAIHYSKWNNLQSQQFNYSSGYIASDGKMFFGGINGFNSFYPDNVKVKPFNSDIVINDFQLFNTNTSSEEGTILYRAINYTDQIKLSHDQSMLSFGYAALNFDSPHKIKYAYKMDGLDKGWNYVGSQRSATYTNLPHGEYTFMVKASNDGENWSDSVKKVRVTITPPFYLYPFAYLIYSIVLLVLFFVFQKILLKRAEKRNKVKLEKLTVEQEKQFYIQKIEFFSTMAHEIRTPLSLITAPLEKLLEFTKLPKEVSNQLTIMDKNSKRLLNLVNQLLDFRRIESDIYEIRKENLDFVVLIQSIYSRFSAMKYQKNIKFTLSTKVSHLNMMGDPEALTKIFNNLLINAFKFTRTKVNISVQEPFVEKSGNIYLLTKIEDDGIGIPEDELQNIFKKYFKVSSSSTIANLIGTGIGLSLAKSLIEKHGGYLEVSSDPNISTVFKVYLPCEKNSVQAPKVLSFSKEEETETDSELLSTAENILVVEDDELLLDFICQNLKQEGYGVQKAYNGVEAMKVLDDCEIDFVLSDVMMPEMDGIELCQKIKNTPDYSHIPVVLLTAKTNSEAEISGIQNGADAYISKPFKWKHVNAVIKNLLKSRANLKTKFASHPFIAVDTLTENVGDKKLLEKITKIIEERITDPKFSVEELSKEIGVSRSNLHKKLKSISGKVPNEFIRLLRLKYAAKLLLQNEYTISEVCYMSGFNSHSYFSKCFYSQFDITPSDFLEENFKTDKV
tara:strand:+ start:26348 stop:30376 length:4029 start_codon:yes stop_codon:yes gene_type:complete